MDVDLIFKIAAIGIVVAVLNQVLSRAGRDEQAMKPGAFFINCGRGNAVFRRLEEGSAKPKQGVFYNGQIYDAYTFVAELIKSAKKRIILIDNYVDETVLTLLKQHRKLVEFCVYQKTRKKEYFMIL